MSPAAAVSLKSAAGWAYSFGGRAFTLHASRAGAEAFTSRAAATKVVAAVYGAGAEAFASRRGGRESRHRRGVNQRRGIGAALAAVQIYTARVHAEHSAALAAGERAAARLHGGVRIGRGAAQVEASLIERAWAARGADSIGVGGGVGEYTHLQWAGTAASTSRGCRLPAAFDRTESGEAEAAVGTQEKMHKGIIHLAGVACALRRNLSAGRRTGARSASGMPFTMSYSCLPRS
ncbi:hypothetical protein B0H13DRAFT_1870045 [Mycena leptocephala]|nr:hypothetical protein B0H13DRAFT_1870045 [Mycena leptocephala]